MILVLLGQIRREETIVLAEGLRSQIRWTVLVGVMEGILHMADEREGSLRLVPPVIKPDDDVWVLLFAAVDVGSVLLWIVSLSDVSTLAPGLLHLEENSQTLRQLMFQLGGDLPRLDFGVLGLAGV